MKVIVNENVENKLHSYYQKRIDNEWDILKQRYKDEEISSHNWYLTFINIIDKIKVVSVKVRKNDIIVFVDVYGKRVDGENRAFVGHYFTEVLKPFASPTVIPIEP